MTSGTPTASRRPRYGQSSGCVTTCQKVDNSGSTLEKLYQMYTKSDLCDVQLQVGCSVFHAHKLILSMSSDVFKTMLTDLKWPDARKACILLNEEPECVQVFGDFVQYMYTGNILLSNNTVLPVLTLSDKYNIHDLSKVCRQYMTSHCHASSTNLKVVSWLQYAVLCGDIELEAITRGYIQLNFGQVMTSEDFLTMRLEILEECLKCEHLVIHSEYALFLGLKKWLMHNTGRDNSRSMCDKKMVQQIMSNIRLPLMSVGQLSAVKVDPFVHTYTSFFTPKLRTAQAFHARPHDPDVQQHNPLPPSYDWIRQNASTLDQSASISKSDCSHKNGHSKSEFSCMSCKKMGLYGSSMQHGVRKWSDVPISCCTSSTGYYTPRNYTCDDWSTCLPIENYAAFPRYASHTYFFSTPASKIHCTSGLTKQQDNSSKGAQVAGCNWTVEESEEHAWSEWQVELYPKGVRFPPAVMIGIPTNYQIDEHCQDTVRLAVMSKAQHDQPCLVDISVLALAAGAEDGSEYVEALAHKSCIFDKDKTIHNLDNIVPYCDLVCSDSKYLTTTNNASENQPWTCFKVVVIIKPR